MSDYAEQVPDKEKVKASVWKKSVFRRVYRKFSEYPAHRPVGVCVWGGGGGGYNRGQTVHKFTVSERES